jgi:N-acetylmuramoyl-L-alanine amidase
MFRFIVITVLSLYTALLLGSSTSYHKVSLKEGEGISVLLDKYGLFDHKVNLSKFYELNNLTTKSVLIKGKEYLLPIKIYKFNGKSIQSTLKSNDLDVIESIKKYNESLTRRGIKSKSYAKDRKLWVPEHLNKAVSTTVASEKKSEPKIKSEDLPTSKKEVKNEEESSDEKKSDSKISSKTKKSPRILDEVKTFDLFGDKYKDVNMFDNQLAGQVFYISSGHGGPDPGAQCKDLQSTLCEDEYAYDVSLRLARDLTQHGATVHVIVQDKNDGIRDDAFLDCDYDETCNGKDLPRRQLDRLKQRADHINRLYNKYKNQGVEKQVAVMIHVDSANEEHRQDVFFYHFGSDAKSKKLAYNLKSTFEEKYEIFQKGRGYKGYVANRGLYMLRKVDPSAVYVELANIRNKSDHIRLMESANRQALANWLFEGLTGIR